MSSDDYENGEINASDFYFAISPYGMEGYDSTGNNWMIVITPKQIWDEEHCLSDEHFPEIEDLLEEYEIFCEAESAYSSDGLLTEIREILLSLGFVENYVLSVFGDEQQVFYDGMGNFIFSNDVTTIESNSSEILDSLRNAGQGSLADAIAASGANVIGVGPGGSIAGGMSNSNPFSDGVTPDMTTQDILALARQKLSQQRAEYEESKKTKPQTNVEVQMVSKYESDWDKTVIFKGFKFRVVLQDEESVIRRMALVGEIDSKLDDLNIEHIAQVNYDTDEIEIYLKGHGDLLRWKMTEHDFFMTSVEKVEQHEG